MKDKARGVTFILYPLSFRSPAADEMHDLDLVRIFNDRLRPIGSSNDRIVQFNCNSLFWKGKMLEQAIEIDRVRDEPFFAVKEYVDLGHCFNNPSLERLFQI